MDSHPPGAAYHLWYVPISLCTDISSIRECVDPPIGRQKGFAEHQRGTWTNNLPLGGRLRTLSLPYLSPFSCSDKKFFSSNNSTYLSNGHLTLQTPFPSYPPGRTTITRCFPPRLYSIHCSLSNIYNVTRRSFSRPHCPRNNTGKLFMCKLITVGHLLDIPYR